MLIAQALGEYGILASLSAAFSSAYNRIEYALGDMGTTWLWIAIAAVVLWLLISRFR
jgi:hypothetical protein